jgi:hypothetical protein
VRGKLSSVRVRRRLIWLAVLAVVVAAVAGLVLLFPGPKPNPQSRLSTEKAEVITPLRSVSFASKKQQVVHTAMSFVKTAVTGRDMAASWDLVAPDMKEGHTKADWAAGQDLPIIHYPALFGRWRLQYSYANEIDLQVALFAHLKQRRPEVFDVTLHPVKEGSRTRWLVSSFLPTPTQGGGAGGSYRSKLFEAPNPPTTTLSARWLLAPLGVFALLPVLLLVLGVRRWRGARLYRAYVRQD